MLIRVLGSAAGGGFPQWNCGCPNCAGVRAGAIRATPRTQESVAISTDGDDWFLLNASPEIRQQIESCPPLHPKHARHSPIQGIFLTNGDLDHCLGLLSLRESHPLVIYATEPVFRGFTEGNVLFRTLQRFADQVTWRAGSWSSRCRCPASRPSISRATSRPMPRTRSVSASARRKPVACSRTSRASPR
jgi:pyrroloquinoline quinone biosynthesis protein B